MEAGVDLGVARSDLPLGDPSYPCSACFLGTGRVLRSAYAALLEGAQVLRCASADGVARLAQLLELQAALGDRPSPYQLHPFPPGTPERRLLDMVPWQRPEAANLLRLLASMLRWWASPAAAAARARYAGDPGPIHDGVVERMVEDYVAARLAGPLDGDGRDDAALAPVIDLTDAAAGVRLPNGNGNGNSNGNGNGDHRNGHATDAELVVADDARDPLDRLADSGAFDPVEQPATERLAP